MFTAPRARRRGAQATRQLLDRLEELGEELGDGLTTHRNISGAITGYAATVTPRQAAVVRGAVADSGLPVSLAERTRLAVRTHDGLPVTITTTITLRDLAHLLAAAVETIDTALASGPYPDADRALDGASVSACYAADPVTAMQVSGLIKEAYLKVIHSGEFGIVPAPTPAHETFATLLLDSNGLEGSTPCRDEWLWRITDELVEDFDTLPDLLDTARALEVVPAPSGPTETRPVAITRTGTDAPGRDRT